ncbi:6-phosphogluconolactonase [Hyphomonas johnsonii]|uniref:6-phosphogluconolactonase n=1 Tax=Hyphomonas johnsonii MHS-2 TaxID=1280950 RepID=A0A059FUZ7_9PROT|nr:6-phosphogluconolactonase [Hyphomonas johnsonii]KCZ94341.1 6-phosphogluconolactonase [Hyphomonas johnsonii MHS-2]
MKHEFLPQATRDDAADFAARMALGVLESAIEESGHASFMVSGGTTPAPMFRRLSNARLAWERVTVGLVDERWVSPEDEGSNEALVRKRLLTGKAGAAGFLPMKTWHANAESAAPDRNQAYRPHCDPIDLILLGMGNDGHTASWFPNAAGLDGALHADASTAVAAIDATGCPVAGAHTDRLTLTGPAIIDSDAAILLIFGAEKRAVFENALLADPVLMPVRYAIDGLGPRLTVIWAP